MEYPILEKIMESAYNKWDHNSQTHPEFFDSLTDVEKKVVAIGNLNYQVENGGFTQYVENGLFHHSAYETLRSFLDEIGTKESNEVLSILFFLAPDVDLNAESKGCMGSYWCYEKDEGAWNDDDDDEDYDPYDRILGICKTLDKRFYKVNDALLASAEEHFSKCLSEA